MLKRKRWNALINAPPPPKKKKFSFTTLLPLTNGATFGIQNNRVFNQGLKSYAPASIFRDPPH
jgi:hypothetical protein